MVQILGAVELMPVVQSHVKISFLPLCLTKKAVCPSLERVTRAQLPGTEVSALFLGSEFNCQTFRWPEQVEAETTVCRKTANDVTLEPRPWNVSRSLPEDKHHTCKTRTAEEEQQPHVITRHLGNQGKQL